MAYPFGNNLKEFKQYCSIIAEEINVEQILFRQYVGDNLWELTYQRECRYHTPTQKEEVRIEVEVPFQGIERNSRLVIRRA